MADRSYIRLNKHIFLSAVIGSAVGFGIGVATFSLWTFLKGKLSRSQPRNNEQVSVDFLKDLSIIKSEIKELKQLLSVFALQPSKERLPREPYLSDEDDEFFDVETDISTDTVRLPQEIIDELDELAAVAMGESTPSTNNLEMNYRDDDIGYGSQAYARCLVYRRAYSRTPDFLWRFARASFLASTEMGEDENMTGTWTDTDAPSNTISSPSSSSSSFPLTLNDLAYDWTSRKQFVQHGLTVARRALSLAKRVQDRQPIEGIMESHTMAEIYKWLAVLVGCASDFVGTTQRITYGAEFKELIDKAIEFNPEDSYSHHLRGRWCYQVYNLSWLERKVAARLFATPPTATLEEAMEDLEEAERIRPDFYAANQLYLAKCYISRSVYSEAATWLKKAKDLIDRNRKPSPQLDSLEVHNEIQMLFSKFASYLTET